MWNCIRRLFYSRATKRKLKVYKGNKFRERRWQVCRFLKYISYNARTFDFYDRYMHRKLFHYNITFRLTTIEKLYFKVIPWCVFNRKNYYCKNYSIPLCNTRVEKLIIIKIYIFVLKMSCVTFRQEICNGFLFFSTKVENFCRPVRRKIFYLKGQC